MRSVSKQTLERLPAYLNYLKSLPEEEAPNISATIIAEELGLNDVQVRKDLAMISSGGTDSGYRALSGVWKCGSCRYRWGRASWAGAFVLSWVFGIRT